MMNKDLPDGTPLRVSTCPSSCSTPIRTSWVPARDPCAHPSAPPNVTAFRWSRDQEFALQQLPQFQFTTTVAGVGPDRVDGGWGSVSTVPTLPRTQPSRTIADPIVHVPLVFHA